MSNFVTDLTTLPDGKADLTVVAVPAINKVTAPEWNGVMQAMYDLRGQLLGGAYHGLDSASPGTPAAVGTAGTARIRYNNGTGNLEVSLNGAAYTPIATRAYVDSKTYSGSIPDATGTPGDVTQNNTRGRVAMPAGSQSLTVTNSNVTSGSVVTAMLQTNDGTLTDIRSVVCGVGSFVIKGNDVATAITNIGWKLEQ